jgi:ligand-binding sensor protein
MDTHVEARRSHTPIVRKAFAGLILVAVAALVVKIVVGFVIAIFGIIVVVAAVLAVLWAVKTLAR